VDVVVAGAGPVGLSPAVGLARAGHSVLVLEKEPGTSEHSRAPLIWPRTLEILDGLEIVDRLLDEEIALSRIELWDADQDRVLFEGDLGELGGETGFPHLLICPQSTTERLLHEALKDAPSGDVLFSAEVVDLRQTNGMVKTRYESEGVNRVGGGLTAHVLPHSRAYGSVHGGSSYGGSQQH
jgi:2-polyprenyl-6-methoxyphenol hydroxylase-like FAD-dependent oxidoreductase